MPYTGRRNEEYGIEGNHFDTVRGPRLNKSLTVELACGLRTWRGRDRDYSDGWV